MRRLLSILTSKTVLATAGAAAYQLATGAHSVDAWMVALSPVVAAIGSKLRDDKIVAATPAAPVAPPIPGGL